MIPYGRQSINQADIDAVIDVLKSDWLTQGPMVPRFEQAVADKIGIEYAVAVNSATSALHIACLALELGPEDWLWTSPNTFVASANCAIYCGAKVDFVDIDPYTYNMSVDALKDKLVEARHLGKLPKIVIPVHFAGQSCDMALIHALAKEYGFKIIEDASHAIGAKYKDKFIGSCVYSDISIFSFHPVKIITTGEGGMATTHNPELAERMRRLRSHGITRNLQEMSRVPDGPWYYEQHTLGYNYRMTDIQAALGLSQLALLDKFIECRTKLALRYEQAFVNFPVHCQEIIEDAISAWHLYVIRVPANRHRLLFEYLHMQDIRVNLHYIPVHLQPYYQQRGFTLGQFPEAEAYYLEAISLPMYTTLSHKQQDLVIHYLAKKLISEDFLNEKIARSVISAHS